MLPNLHPAQNCPPSQVSESAAVKSQVNIQLPRRVAVIRVIKPIYEGLPCNLRWEGETAVSITYWDSY